MGKREGHCVAGPILAGLLGTWVGF
jgi:hypothetical protein